MIIQLLQYVIAAVAAFCAIISFNCIYCNWYHIILCVCKKKSHSPVIVFGPILGIIALLIFPFYDLKSYWWIPIVADMGGNYIAFLAFYEEFFKK